MDVVRVVIGLVVVLLLAGCSREEPTTGGDAPQKSGMTVLVTGATGTQGGAVAKELLSRGHQVRALTRNPQQPAALGLATKGATVMVGDFDNAKSLDQAMHGVDGVFAVTDFWEHGYEREVSHGIALIEAAQRANVRHFVFSSVAGADQDTGMAHFDSKLEIEKRLRDSGLAYSILRPVEFMDNWRYSRVALNEGLYQNPRNPDDTHQWIAAADIGFFVGEAFDNPDHWLGKTEAIAGDEMTLVALTDVMAEAFGHPVTYVQVDWDEFERAMGAELTGMYRWFAAGGYDVNVAELRARYPQLTTVREYLGQLASSTNVN